jgi:hypothetical protein
MAEAQRIVQWDSSLAEDIERHRWKEEASREIRRIERRKAVAARMRSEDGASP